MSINPKAITTAALKRVLALTEKKDALAKEIEEIEKRIASVLGGGSAGAATKPAKKRGPAKKKRSMSPEARERIALAARARWAEKRSAASNLRSPLDDLPF